MQQHIDQLILQDLLSNISFWEINDDELALGPDEYSKRIEQRIGEELSKRKQKEKDNDKEQGSSAPRCHEDPVGEQTHSPQEWEKVGSKPGSAFRLA